MRDYAKKSPQSFGASQTARAFNTPEPAPSEPRELSSAKNNLIKLGLGILIILILGLLLAQGVYKHLKNTSALISATSATQATPAVPATPQAPPAPAFDFYHSLSSNSPAHPPTNSAANSAANSASTPAIHSQNNPPTAAPIITLPQNTPNKITQAPITPAPISTPAPAQNNSQNISPSQYPPQYTLQVGAYRNKDEARSMQARLLLLGLHPSMISTDTGWYRVNLGPYSSKNSAEAIKHKLQNAHINNSVIKPKD